jgi:butyrate kinase
MVSQNPQPSSRLILTINPGSTSTKIALFAEDKLLEKKSMVMSSGSTMSDIWSQLDDRIGLVQNFLDQIRLKQPITGVVGRGGLLKPVKRGTFPVNESMLKDARIGLQGEHVSNLGCAMADHFGKKYNCHAVIVDPVSVDEFEPIARISGHPLIERRSLSHALNIRAAAIHASKILGLDGHTAKYVVAHLGGGISVAAVKQGAIVDVNDASSDGPFSPERTGGLPLQPFIDLCFSGNYTRNEMRKLVMGNGGLVAYLGTKNIPAIEQQIEKSEYAETILNAMIYQIAKEIGAMYCALASEADAVVLTGGLCHSERLIEGLKNHVKLAPVVILAGEFEMEAMAQGLLRVLNGEEDFQHYP